MLTHTNDQADRAKRITKTILDIIGASSFGGKTVVDLGAGLGLIGSAFARLVGNGKVIAVDARANTCKILAKTYPHIRVEQCDLDFEFPASVKNADYCIDVDLICHLKQWREHLERACESTKTLILESAVMDSDEEGVSTYQEDKNGAYASFNGFASIPSAKSIETILTDCGMEFKRYDQAKLNSADGSRVYDWKVANTGECSGKLRRLWIAKRVWDKPIAKPLRPKMIASPALPIEPVQPQIDRSIAQSAFIFTMAEVAVSKELIPKVIHQIWIGDNPRPSRLMNGWKNKHPDWDYVLWTNDMVGWENQNSIFRIHQLAGKADIMRYEILYRYGGIYIDADTECVQRLTDDFLEHRVWASYESEVVRPGLICNGQLGSRIGEPIWRDILHEITKRDLERPAWQCTGPELITEVAKTHPELFVYPGRTFAPTHFEKNTPAPGDAPIYGKHLWGSQGKVYEVLPTLRKPAQPASRSLRPSNRAMMSSRRR